MTAVSRIYGKIGFAGLWNGLPVRIASAFPSISLACNETDHLE